MKTATELVLELNPDHIDESLRLSGTRGNIIPGTKYLYEQMREKGWSLSDAKIAFEWIQETERSIMAAFQDYGGEG